MDKNLFGILKTRVEKLSENNFADIYPESVELCAECAVSKDPVPFKDRMKLHYHPVYEGEVWGRTWESAWFHVTATVPESFAGRELCLRLNTGGELLLFDPNGVPIYGLTGYSVFDTKFFKDTYVLGKLKPGTRVEFWCEAAANSLFGAHLPDPESRNPEAPLGYFYPVIQNLKLCVFDRQVWLFLLEMETLTKMLDCYGHDDYRGRQLLARLNRAMDVYAFDPANAAAARRLLKDSVFQLKAEDGALIANTIGHAHIDVGWLWPVRESTRKAARTFASQLSLMEQYKDFKFGASQPYLYMQVKKHYPKLFAKIRKRVKEGRWELQGGMFVEADCNLISGESMVRQFLHGKNFFMDEFGVDVRTVWIPDVFGYSAAMPQIIRKAQCDYFLTQKISWSQINRFPYHTFNWYGVDGSSVVTHFPPEDTYNAGPSAPGRIKAADRFEEAAFLPGFMSLVGIGDGGGGPSENYVERCRILSDLRGCPKSQWRFAVDFFRELEEYRSQLPEWHGELYLELHRGTLTTQSRTKRGNRKCEQTLTALEFLAAALPPEKWPRKQLDAAWKTLLLNQFHDIIPGSSIRQVYERTEKEHVLILQLAQEEIRNAVSQLFRPKANSAVLVNTLSNDWRGLAELPDEWKDRAVLDEAGNELPAQPIDGKLRVSVSVPAGGCVTLRKGRRKADATKDTGLRVLENPLIRYEFDLNGHLLRAFDKELNREFLSGAGNVLSLYNDRPVNYEAWDVDIYYPRDKKGVLNCVSAGTVLRGPAADTVEFAYRTDKSEFRQLVVLRNDTKRLDFTTWAQWHEHRTLLRVAFPTAIRAEVANFDIQYGYVARNTHNNTTWDQAKFETCGQRYADLSDRDCGVALLNDCKYGYCVKGSTLDLALLRSPVHPDRFADRGSHIFTYSLLPHAGALPDSCVMDEAANLNRPALFADGLQAGKFKAPCRVESDGIRLEVLKRAEKDDSLILRLVEIRGRHSAGTLHFAAKPDRVSETDLLEWGHGPVLPLKRNALALNLKPFEILTLRAEFGKVTSPMAESSRRNHA